MSAAAARAPRFASVDALRGLTVAAMLLVNDPGDWAHVYAPLLHSEWIGCTPTDLVFPFFLFIVGVSIALGIAPRVEAGADLRGIRHAVLVRSLRIIGLGLLLNLLAFWLLDKPWFRPWGVLQRIGLCFLVAGWLATWLRPRGQWAVLVSLLAGYGLLLAGTGGTAQWSNIVSRVDTAVLGHHVYAFDVASGRGHDPEGLLSTLPSIASVLLGLRAGDALRHGRTRMLLLAGIAMLAIAGLLACVQPMIKNLWTPSYALWTAGWASLALWLAHRLVDVRGWAPLGRSFGVNAITAYTGSEATVIVLMGLGWLDPLYQAAFAGWMTPRFGPYLPSLAFAVAFTAAWWCVVKGMDRRGIHLKL